jgi:hypothetical protein
MLTKMETIYLGLLRGFILIAATLALLAAALLVVTTIPDILTRTGITKTEPPRSSLSQFMAEQKPQESTLDETGTTAETIVDPEIATAAKNIRKYLGTNATGNWEQGLQAAANQLPPAVQSKYRRSLVTLTEELLASTGKKLSERKVAELVEWHQRRFVSTVQEQEQEKAAADAAFTWKIGAAFAALMMFVLIAFIFLFVRIERNLRVVRVQQAEDYA